jgi:hypothetical protein
MSTGPYIGGAKISQVMKGMQQLTRGADGLAIYVRNLGVCLAAYFSVERKMTPPEPRGCRITEFRSKRHSRIFFRADGSEVDPTC